jgi:glycine/D-amino acid oxidase-like deaminating enzyme
MSQSREVVIVGGGAAGCAVAYYLGKAGVKATIAEREGIGTQASGYAAGGLNPLHGVPATLAPLAMESFKLHLTLWDELKGVTGSDCQARIVSMIKLAFEETELSAFQDLLDLFEATEGFSARWLEAAEIHKLEPRITPDVLRGLYLYGNGVVDSYLFTTSLAKAAERCGITCRSGRALGLQRSANRVTGVLLEDGAIACDAVVLAMGPWAKVAENWLGCPIPIEPLKGEILRMALPEPRLAHDLLGPEVSLYSRSGGLVWCGATTEWRGFDKEPSESAQRFLLQGATRLMPAMASANLVQHTVCLRPVAPDGLPILGRAPAGTTSTWPPAGGRKGFSSALASAKPLLT